MALIAVVPLMVIPCTALTKLRAAWKWYEVKDGQVQVHLHMFWSSKCPHCATAQAFLGELQKRHGWLKVSTHETFGTPGNMDLYQKMAQSIGKRAGQVPAFFYCKQLTIGFTSDETTGKQLEDALIYYRNALQKQVDDRAKPKPTPTPQDMPLDMLPLLLVLPLDAGAGELDLELDLEIPPPPPDCPSRHPSTK